MHSLRAEDRTEQRLFENVAAIRAILASARTETARRKAERSLQARRGAREVRAAERTDANISGGASPATLTGGGVGDGQPPSPTPSLGTDGQSAKPPPWAGQAIAPFPEVERL